MKQVLICQYINCQTNNSAAVLAAFSNYALPDIEVVGSECQGQCNMGATVRILPDQVWYCRVQPEDVPEIIASHLQQNQWVDRLLHPRFHPNL
jgi:(2Fe-2S) ferredoxin